MLGGKKKLSKMNENSISISFDSMSIETEQNSYRYDHDFYESHRESSSDL